MVYNVDSMSDTHLYRVSGTGMCAKTATLLVSLFNTSSCLFVREITIFCRSDFCNLE